MNFGYSAINSIADAKQLPPQLSYRLYISVELRLPDLKQSGNFGYKCLKSFTATITSKYQAFNPVSAAVKRNKCFELCRSTEAVSIVRQPRDVSNDQKRIEEEQMCPRTDECNAFGWSLYPDSSEHRTPNTEHRALYGERWKWKVI